VEDFGLVRLGMTDITVSRICVGTWSWGSRLVWGYGRAYGEQDVCAAYSESIRRGVNFFDSAEIYGMGSSERLLGGCIKGSPEGTRPVIATKFTPMFRWRKASLGKALAKSLRRLGMDNVHLYQVHQMDSVKKIPRWMDALADAYDRNLIGAIGVSNYCPQHMEVAMDHLGKRGLKLSSNQMHLSLLFRRHEKNGLLRMCRDKNITFLAYMPLAWGMLAGKFTPKTPPRGLIRPRVVSRKLVGRSAPLLKVMNDIAWKAPDRTVAQVAINWVRAKGAIPIVGVKTLKQAAEDIGALGWSLSQNETEELDAASDALGEEPLRTFWTS
jgi:aryl-alcohol dehydrogenase-like predicted oxidoreductase